MALVAWCDQSRPVCNRWVTIVKAPENISALSLLFRLRQRVGERAAPTRVCQKRPLDLQLDRVEPGLHPIIHYEDAVVRKTAGSSVRALNEIHVVRSTKPVVRERHQVSSEVVPYSPRHLQRARRHHVVLDQEHLWFSDGGTEGPQLCEVVVLGIPGSAVNGAGSTGRGERDGDDLELPPELFVEQGVPVITVEIKTCPTE